MAAALGLVARPMIDEDMPFAEALYASTRADELAATGWPAEQQHAFLAQQHRAQHHHYRRYYEGADWLILERDGQKVGRLYLVEWESELRIIDVSLVPSARGRGLGSALLSDIQQRGADAGKRVTIHVEVHNPARRLYERLGFVTVEDKGVYLLMAWTPGEAEPTPPA